MSKMKPIDEAKAAYQKWTFRNDVFGDRDPTSAIITAFLDAVLSDPEAMERLQDWICGTRQQARDAIEALKQEIR